MKRIIISILSVLFFISAFLLPVSAEEAAGAANSPVQLSGTILMVVAFGLIFYFIIYRPQKKQEKQVKEMRDNLSIGDEISTTGGILGRIVKIKDDIITIETGSDKNKLKIYKWAVRSVEIPANAPEDETQAK